MPDTLLSIRGLRLAMRSFEGEAQVLNGIDLTVARGEIWGLVGESGCGKSLTGLSISRLLPSPPARYAGGELRFAGRDLLKLSQAEMQPLRGKRIGMIFQDPTTNLNPAFRIGEQLADVALAAARQEPSILDCPSNASGRERKRAAWRLAARMLVSVGIPEAETRLQSYPHQFSGGMRQRVLIAMALIGQPDLLIADEPTTALDVSVQAQILNLIKQAVAERDMGVILITHNLGVVAETCSHVAVMYAGNIVEAGPVAEVIGRPVHPYTRALMAAIPTRETQRGDLKGLAGQVPNLVTPPPGCRFAPRCALAVSACRDGLPPPVTVGPGHIAACLRAGEITAHGKEAAHA
ncbi:ABC transporter ATP-binding protein [Haematobacter missouriensis]|uniref:ABC transporter ATP-binding protein n=1 Tax=Haematobacter missouriensis TaxID=366616 RepID=A0A212ANL0_9RHOB|nr:ABC transporter ATP-binding protein [Haematobacter missouriensis]KFI25084.1 ABC transporter ATP-binding protein [Haematobacter missouriensis]OWJ73842.1 ABC transporter ATP-binding protein [Haematobacter missouriensis]OWJ83023.1 ABC transporter ATP-binding protein [Haematobacter missouriensis]